MIVHGLVVHSVQPGECGVQLTEVVMSAGSLGWVHCRIILSHNFTVAATLVGGGSDSTGSSIIVKQV